MVEILGDRSMLSARASSSHRDRVYVIVVPSGAKAGYISAVILHVLSWFGIRAEKFKLAVGTSAGSINLLAFCAGQQEITPDVYLHLADKPWVFPTWGEGGWLTFHHYLMGILRGEVFSEFRLDIDTFKQNPTRLLLAVSDLYGQISYHDAKEVEDVFELVHACSAILPFAFGRTINGKMAIDGAYSHSHCEFARVVRTLMRQHPESEICVLFVSNRPRIEHQHWLEYLAYRGGMFASLWWSPWLLASALRLEIKVAKSERTFHKPVRRRIRICAIYPTKEEEVVPHEWRPDVMVAKGKQITESLCRKIDAVA